MKITEGIRFERRLKLREENINEGFKIQGKKKKGKYLFLRYWIKTRNTRVNAIMCGYVLDTENIS